MPDWLHQISPNAAGYASVAAIAVLALIVFRVARRVVMLGYFVLYFFIGFGIVYAASAWAIKSFQVPLSMPIIGGLAFAAVANAVRAKLMRLVGAIMLVFLFSLAGRFWSQYAQNSKAAQAKNKDLAYNGLNVARNEFGALAQYLPSKNGKIAPGWISPEALRKAGIQPDLKKVDEKPAWHTWLTGLYNQETEDLGIWTPGGTPDQAKRGLQLKPKP
jgi:hypothetical protein